jgi:hypothetical protein
VETYYTISPFHTLETLTYDNDATQLTAEYTTVLIATQLPVTAIEMGMLSLVDVDMDSSGSWSKDVLRVIGESQGHSEAVKDSSSSDTSSSEPTSPRPDQSSQIHLQATLNCLIGIGNNKATKLSNEGDAGIEEEEEGREKTKARKLAHRKATVRLGEKLLANVFEEFRQEAIKSGNMAAHIGRVRESAKIEKDDRGEKLEEDENWNTTVNGRKKRKNQALYPHGHCSVM